MTDTAQQAAEAFQGSTDAASDAPEVASDAEKLFGKVKTEIEGLVDLAGHEWDLLKAAIDKHL
jgi:hypothetical protein